MSFRLTVFFSLFCLLKILIWTVTRQSITPGSMADSGLIRGWIDMIRIGYALEAWGYIKDSRRVIQDTKSEILRNKPLKKRLLEQENNGVIVSFEKGYQFSLNDKVYLSAPYTRCFPSAIREDPIFRVFSGAPVNITVDMQKEELYLHLLATKKLIKNFNAIFQIRNHFNYHFPPIPDDLRAGFKPHYRRIFDMPTKARLLEYTGAPLYFFCNELCRLINQNVPMPELLQILLIGGLTAGLFLINSYESKKLNEQTLRLALRGLTRYHPCWIKTPLCLGQQFAHQLLINPVNKRLLSAVNFFTATDPTIQKIIEESSEFFDPETRVLAAEFKPIIRFGSSCT